MSESNAFVAGGGGFVRLRDSSNGFSAEINRQKRLEAERLAQKQAENERRERKLADEKAQQQILNEGRAREAFRDYHNPAKRGEIAAMAAIAGRKLR